MWWSVNMNTRIVLLLSFLCIMPAAHSEGNDTLAFSVIRTTYTEGQNSVSFKIKNPTQDIAYLIQTSIASLDENTGLNTVDDDDKKRPFIITPPLHRLNPGSTYAWRVFFSGKKEIMPDDRESVYVAKFRVIPSTDPKFDNVEEKSNKSNKSNENNKIQLTTIQVLHFKLYYRPKSFENMTIENEQKQITFKSDGNKLIVKNNSPIFMTFNAVTVDGVEVEERELYKPLKPLGEQVFNLKNSVKAGSKVTWSILDEMVLPLNTQNSTVN